MNPQYLPPQQFGGPPNFQTNRSSPSLGTNPGMFQNVPLGPPKPGQMAPPMNQFLPSGGPPSRPAIPSSQLPPSQSHESGFQQNNPFSIPPAMKGAVPFNIPKGSHQTQNGPPQFQNGPSGQMPPNMQQTKPAAFNSTAQTSNESFNPAASNLLVGSASGPPRTGSNQPTLLNQSSAGPPNSIPSPMPGSLPNVSNSSPITTSELNASVDSQGSILRGSPSGIADGPPLHFSNGPPTQSNATNTSRGQPSGVPPNMPGGPPLSMTGSPPGNLSGLPSNMTRGPQTGLSGGTQGTLPTSLSGGPPSGMSGGAPPNMPGGPPPNMSGGPPPNMSGGPPPNMSGGPPPNMSGGPPPNMSGGPPVNMSGGPPPNMSGGPPPNMPGGPPPNFSGGPPPNMSGGPPPNMPGGPPPSMPAGLPPNMSVGPPPGMSGNLPPNMSGNQPHSMPGGPPSGMPGGPAPGMPAGPLPGMTGGHPSGLPGVPPPGMSGGPLQGMPGAQLSGGPPSSMSGTLPPSNVGYTGAPSSIIGNTKQPGPVPMGYPSSNVPGGPNQFSNQFGQSSFPGNQPPQNQFSQYQGGPPPMGPPRPGGVQSPVNNSNFNTQPGFNQPNTFSQMPGMPPLPNPNQLSNQMQGMNLSGPRQYPGVPGGPMKSTINGDMGPHMPPPLNQQQARNSGYPPMPGQAPMPGQVTMPGQGPMPGQVPGGPYPQQGYQQPQQQRRLDPDQMPNPVQVTQDDQQNRSGVFVTNQKGLVPPLVTTNFAVQDQGNASPRFIRSTMYNVPISQDIIKQTAVPFSLVISPMARPVDQEYPPPIVNFGELGPVRCIRCKAYMCPFMQFIDSGRRFQCLFCKATTDVPSEYFQHLDHTGQRMDRFERPELILGTYEFVATADYCRNNTLPKPPAIIFVMDVSYNNVKSGFVHMICSQMKEIIQSLPVDQGHEKSNMRVGFITYNSSVHFYNIKGTLAAPQMLVVGDTQEMFMPLLDGFLCTPEESGPVIDALMQQIPAMFGDTRETETVLLPAIQAGVEALKASECAGKLLVFHSTLPAAEAPGKLKNRDDRKLLGTDKEKTILTPQNQAYNQLGQDCVGAGCSVDLFIFNNSYIDIATIGQVARLTGGEVFKYTYFQADIDGDRLINDIIMDISRPIAFDSIMRVRTSTGVRPTDFYGHFFMSNTTDMELAAVDCDKAVAIEVKHDDKLTEEEGVYIQAALLYTSCSGQRRLRIINLSLKTCSQMADLYRSCELDTLINYLSKQAVYRLLDNNPKAVKDAIVNRAAQILATYRKNCASPSSAGQLILPECMKLLPLYVNCLLKSDALSGGSDMTIDDRSFAMMTVMTMDITSSVSHFYPRLIPVHEIDASKDPVEVPAPIRCSLEKMSEQGVYILENGIHMFLWFGLSVNPDFIQKLFGAASAIQVDIERVGLPELDNTISIAVRTLIEEIRIQRHHYMRLTIVRQREKLEHVFKHFLVEDRGTDGSPSYVDFLCHMHKEIRTLLS